MKPATALLTLLAFGFSAAVHAAETTKAPGKPNILLILADDLGWGDLSCYPQDPAHPDSPIETPHLDALAAQGVKFTQAYSQNMCSPSRAAILTGRLPQRFGYYDNGCSSAGLPKSESTLAELLRKHGYATACIGKWHLGDRAGYRPLDRGFDRFYGFLGAAHDYFKPSVGSTGSVGILHEGAYVFDQDAPVQSMKHLTDQLTDVTIEFIHRCQESQRPFFIYLPYNAPHGPEQPRLDRRAEFETMPHVQNHGRTLARSLIDGIDVNVGRIMRDLFLRRLDGNTLVIFASDNGGNDYETSAGFRTVTHNGGLRGCKFMCWEGGIRVPLILRWPGHLPKGAIYTKPVNLVDLYATIAAAAGAAIPEGRKLDAVNLLPFVEGRDPGTPHNVIHACNARGGQQWSVRQGDWKLVNDYPDTSYFHVKPRPATILGLFDLSKDPGERRNLLDRFPDKATELKKLHEQFMEDCPPTILQKAPVTRENTPAQAAPLRRPVEAGQRGR